MLVNVLPLPCSVCIDYRYSVLEMILRAIEALSASEDSHSKEICSSKQLFHLVCDLMKLQDKAEVVFAFDMKAFPLSRSQVII